MSGVICECALRPGPHLETEACRDQDRQFQTFAARLKEVFQDDEEVRRQFEQKVPEQ